MQLDPSPAPPRSARPRAGLALRLLLAGVALSGTLASSELALRLATGTALLAVEPYLAPRGTGYAPGQLARYKGPEWDVEIAVNTAGFRDAERSSGDGRAGSLVVLGSSFVEGHGVSLDDTFAKQLQRLARERGQDLWVYNAGHHATAVARQARVYREHFRAVPDLATVVLALCLNQDIAGPGQSDLAPPMAEVSRVKVFLGEHSALYNVVNRRVKSSGLLRRAFCKAGLLAADDVLAVPPYQAAATAPLLAHALALVRELAAEVRADGRRLVVALLPMKEQVLDPFFESLLREGGTARERVDRLGAHRRALAELASAGIEVVDLLPALGTPASDAPAHFFQGDRHYSPRGHAAIARALLPVLSGSLPIAPVRPR